METQTKSHPNSEVLKFLAETFPQCFILQGDTKPLKIGIFQDLSERLSDNDEISKTSLRGALRYYTNSWRYLHSIKEGVARVDLDGNEGDKVEAEHAQHAQEKLKESKAKFKPKKETNKPSYKKAGGKTEQFRGKSAKLNKNKGPKRPPPAKLTDSDIAVGTKVTVKLGKAPVAATISEINKDGVTVQLDSGMAVKVDPKTLRLMQK